MPSRVPALMPIRFGRMVRMALLELIACVVKKNARPGEPPAGVMKSAVVLSVVFRFWTVKSVTPSPLVSRSMLKVLKRSAVSYTHLTLPTNREV